MQDELYETLTKASLGRVIQHAQRAGTTSFAILTSNRHDVDAATNKRNFKLLKQHLQRSKLGHFYLAGHWTKEDGTVVKEPSLFVPGITQAHARRLGKVFKQEAILYAGPEHDGDAHIHYTDGSKRPSDPVGKVHAGKLAEVYSKVRGHDFTFKAFYFTEGPTNWASALAEGK